MTELRVELATQQLWLQLPQQVPHCFSISTARAGAGELQDSMCTPCGRHEIAARIGAGCALNTVFQGRVPSGEIYSEALARQAPGRDWILTRILWLRGLEPGRNQGGNRDTYSRYIYIHGAPDTVPMGIPGSRGCIRMRNADMIQVFDQVAVGDPVWIMP